MNRFIKYSVSIIAILAIIMVLPSCKKFFNPKEEINPTESELYKDWYDYRSAVMGLYGLQQKMVEQLMIMGELRGDLLEITPNADPDMVEIYNFNVSKTNQYASPTNYFKLIAACNRFILIVKTKYPRVADPNAPTDQYDQVYGEALCMRAWAYFNAVRIYQWVPFIPETMTSVEEIENFVNSSGPYVDSVHINYSIDGYHNDTVHQPPVVIPKQLYNEDMIIDYFTAQLENSVKAVGYNYYLNNNDNTWEVTTWSTWAMHSLLGHMYLTRGDLVKAAYYFDLVMKNSTSNLRYQLDFSFSAGNWPSIFTGIDNREHIYTIWFNKAYSQQNRFQEFFWPIAPYKYMLKPTAIAVSKWENVWRGQNLIEPNQAHPELSKMGPPLLPPSQIIYSVGDVYRGYDASYLFVRNGVGLDFMTYQNMLYLRSQGDDRSVRAIMDGEEPMVYKYSVNKNIFDEDANYMVYRAAGIHLYQAEVGVFWIKVQPSGILTTNKSIAEGIVNDGSYYNVAAGRPQFGVRGRVGLGSGYDAIKFSPIHYLHDSLTNRITGWVDFSTSERKNQYWYEEQILDERARELAWEGERYYDIMRVAKRRGDPSFFARMISAKFPEGKREQIYNLLLNENNWYINYFK